MTDLERAADLVARCVPTGFSTQDDNQRACNLIDDIAAEILLMDSDPAPEGLTALVSRLQRKLETQAIDLAELRDQIRDQKDVALLARADALLGGIHGSEGLHIDGVTGLDGEPD